MSRDIISSKLVGPVRLYNVQSTCLGKTDEKPEILLHFYTKYRIKAFTCMFININLFRSFVPSIITNKVVGVFLNQDTQIHRTLHDLIIVYIICRNQGPIANLCSKY